MRTGTAGGKRMLQTQPNQFAGLQAKDLYGSPGAAGMLGAKHIKFVATMNKDAIIKLVNEQMWPKTDADVPSFKAGDTITVSYKIVEGNKERVQSFRGVVIQI